MYRRLLLALVLAVACLPTALHAQAADEEGTSTTQSVDLPRSRGGEVEEAGSDPGEEAQEEDSQADGGAATSSEGSGEGTMPESGEGDQSPESGGPSSASELATGSDGTSSPTSPGQGTSARGSPDGSSPDGPAAGQAGADQNRSPLQSPLALGLVLAATAAAGATLLTAKLLMPWPRPRLSCACDVTPPSLPDQALALHPPDFSVSAESTCGAPSIAGNLVIEEGTIRDV